MTCGGTFYGGRRRKAGKKTRRGGVVADNEDQCIKDGGVWRDNKCLPTMMRGGVMYGATEAIAPGAMAWGGVDTSKPVSPVTGGDVPDPFGTSPDITSKITGGRRRKLRKGGKSKKTKKRTAKKAGRRRRTMRGGTWSPNAVNVAGAGYGFVSAEGFHGGIAPAAGYQANVGGAPMNAAGVRTL